MVNYCLSRCLTACHKDFYVSLPLAAGKADIVVPHLLPNLNVYGARLWLIALPQAVTRNIPDQSAVRAPVGPGPAADQSTEVFLRNSEAAHFAASLAGRQPTPHCEERRTPDASCDHICLIRLGKGTRARTRSSEALKACSKNEAIRIVHLAQAKDMSLLGLQKTTQNSPLPMSEGG